MRKKFQGFGRLELIAFVSGFVLMAFELIGARLLAPYIGSSTYVWTSVIGVIIAALSTGYFYGGKLADKRNQAIDVAFLCLSIGVAVGAMLMTFEEVMKYIVMWQQDQRLQGVFASLVLFAPISVLLGMLSPYLVKLKVTSLQTSGQSVAGLSALNSIGGIAGTFITGFIIFSYIGSREALAVIVILAVGASWLMVPRQLAKWRVLLSLFAILTVWLPLTIDKKVVQIDTPSAHYQVEQGQLVGSTRQLKFLSTGPGAAQSGIFLDKPNELAFWYTNQAARLVEAAPVKKNILVLGGGAFSLPEHFAKAYPDSKIDVVEIDPKLPDIAVKYFDYEPQLNIRTIIEDARSYVAAAKTKYDAVVVDVYSDTSIPFSLLTQEFGRELGVILTPGGMVIINVIAGQTSPCSDILQAVDQAYRVDMPYGQISHNPKATSGQRTNFILTYTKERRGIPGMKPFDALQGMIYTDNFMPAERLQQACQSAS